MSARQLPLCSARDHLSPVGTIWKSCRLNLSKIVDCFSCWKCQFIEFVCAVCCSIDNLKVKETVGVDVVFSSCTKTRLMQAVNPSSGWVLGYLLKALPGSAQHRTGRLTLALKKSTMDTIDCAILACGRLYFCWPGKIWHLELCLPVWDLSIFCRHYSWGDCPQRCGLVASASLQPGPEVFSQFQISITFSKRLLLWNQQILHCVVKRNRQL